MEILYKNTSELIPYEKNPRINDAAVEATKQSIANHGFVNPIIIDADGVIVAGHTRLKAAQALGLKCVPCVVMEADDPEKIRQYRIIDNKTSEISSWNIPRLIEELSGIQELDTSSFKFNFENNEAEEATEEYLGNLAEGVEIDIDEFGDDRFEYECPWCGFKWNE